MKVLISFEQEMDGIVSDQTKSQFTLINRFNYKETAITVYQTVL